MEAQLRQRLDKGKKEYGHGVRVRDDTRKYGTLKNSWREMALEEILDAMIYLAAADIKDGGTESTDGDDNERIMAILLHYHTPEISQLYQIGLSLLPEASQPEHRGRCAVQ